MCSRQWNDIPESNTDHNSAPGSSLEFLWLHFVSPIIWWSISDSQEWTNCPSDKKIDKMQHSIKFPSLTGKECHKDLDLIPHKTLNYWRCGQLKTVIALNIFNHTSLFEVIKKAIHCFVPFQAILVVSTGVHLMWISL